jgi:hypothetical protein
MSESEGLKKASLVFVRNTSSATATNPSQSTAQPAVLDRKRVSTLLPTGSRLVARLQTAISTAVKTPAIAVIEYNYERNGEIVIPAGTKAIGQLSQANRNGQVGLRFTALEMPDGTTESIEGAGVSLEHGPLKGIVNGRNGVKRALVRSITGVGTMAAYLVGGRGYGGLTGPVDQSVLLRERIASNIGLAGEQELMALSYTQNVVVMLPGNTRFYIVLQEPVTEPSRPDLRPAGPAGSRNNIASAEGQALPTAAELRELVALKNELTRMYREVAATRTGEPPAPQQWGDHGSELKAARSEGRPAPVRRVHVHGPNGINQYKHGISLRYLFLEDEGRASESAGRNEFREIAFEASLRRVEEHWRSSTQPSEPHMMPLRQGESRCIERAGIETLRAVIETNDRNGWGRVVGASRMR